MKPQAIFLCIIISLFSFTAAAQSNLDSILSDFHNRPDRILVASHRATHLVFPENSIAAMKEAIRIGVDIIETDVRETKDGVLVCIHDKTIDRTTTGKGKVEDMTYAELQQYFLLFNGKPTRDKIPAFEKVLQLVKGKIMLDIDYKADGDRAAKATTKLLRKMKIEKQCLFFLYDYKDAATLHTMNPYLQFMARTYNKADVDSVLQMTVAVPAIHGDADFYTDSLMAQIRNAGKRVWMNALGKYDTMETAKTAAGFDAMLTMKQTNVIQTDLPEALLIYLQAKGLHR
ncbi:glycerophosphodiester phosphodiesterase family protein [soil metagenome]